MNFLTGNILKHHPHPVLPGGWFIWGSHSMQCTLKFFLTGFCPEMEEESTNLWFFFLNEVIVCQSHSVLTDCKCQNLPSLGSYCEMYDVKFEHSFGKSDYLWSNGINQDRTCYLSQHFDSSHINKILVF